MKEIRNFNLSLIRNVLQACKLFVVLIIYPNLMQKGMFPSPPTLSFVCVYVRVCTCLGCIVVVLCNVAISTACYSGPLNGTITVHCCSSQILCFPFHTLDFGT
jgi:hypothetical protein